MNRRLNFKVDAKAGNSAARACTYRTLHNEVKTPVFMPVATFGALRTQNMQSAADMDFPVLLANTYHLLLRPGTEVFEKFGGIHKFINWKNSVLTDSGGFQIFSLSKSFKITEDGARFKSYTDGREYLLSPELSIATQRSIGSDIMMVLDQCISSKSDETLTKNSVELTARWAERSLNARADSPQALFGIVQGACFPKLRKLSAAQITSLPFDGFAIGGLAVGESDEERKDMTALTASLLPADYPRYLMGVGTPLDLLEAVHRGVDMFDCILPTAMAQQGVAYTSSGKIELRRGVYKFDERPLDQNCDCQACRNYSRSYLHHLRKVNEYFGAQLIGQHNLLFYKRLMDAMREHILKDDFSSFYGKMKIDLAREDDENPPTTLKPKNKKNNYQLGNYEVVKHADGFHSIKHMQHGEVMHSVTEPVTEAMNLYVKQSGFKKAVIENSDDYVIWDVGLGAGTNAMTTIIEAEKVFSQNECAGRLVIISFENDLDSMRLAIQNPALFNHVRHAAAAGILKNGNWLSKDGKIEWKLLHGDFSDQMKNAENPNCVYYDMFSINTSRSLWSFEVFSEIFSRKKERGTRLLTYSVSTQVRSSLLASGFFVGMGAAAGPKMDTTAAFTTMESSKGFTLLGADWLERWKRSSAKFDCDASDITIREIEREILNHPQFRTE